MNQEQNSIPFSKVIYLIFKKLIWNKYFIISMLFIAWMIFFDSHSLLNHFDLAKQISTYENEKKVLEEKLKQSKEKYTLLKTDKNERERYARENYFMKKSNEDIIIVTYKQDSIK